MHDVMEAKHYYSACAIDSSTRNILDKIISAFYTGRPTHKWSPKLVEERKKKIMKYSYSFLSFDFGADRDTLHFGNTNKTIFASSSI